MAGARQEPTLPSVFLSYARADDEDGFVREVYDTLRNRGFTVWWDQVSMPSRALTFLPEIAEAIDASDRLLLVLSPTAVQSEYVRAEWQYALVKDKVVTPVLRRGGFELLPSELEATSCGDARASREKDKALEAIVRLASYPPPPLASAASVPVPPPCYRPRSDPFARVAGRLGLEEPKRLAVPEEERTVLVHGMGGVGKSVLAAAVARSAMIRRVFSDGVIWVAVGRDAQPLAVLQQIALRLGDDLAKYATEAAARQQLAVRLDRAAVLIVLDNIWSRDPVKLVREALGVRCRLLLTAREPSVLEVGAPTVSLGPFSPDEALAYLAGRARAAGSEPTPAMAEVARECGYLPFALALAGAMIASTSWERLLERLKAADLRFMEARIPGYPYTDLLRALQVSVDHLRESEGERGRIAVDRYLEIAAFRWETGVPEAALAILWRARGGLDECAAEDVLTRLARCGLVRAEGHAPRRLVRLHDLQRDYLWCHVERGARAREHAAIVDAYASFAAGAPFVAHDDGYFLENCFHHLEHADRAGEMHAILAREAGDGASAWWATRFAHGQVLGFVADVRRASVHAWRSVSVGQRPDAEAVARAVRYALMIASARSAVGEVPLQLVSRLLAEKLWTADQALALIEWAGHGSGLIDALGAVFPDLSPDRRPQAVADALQLARGQVEAGDRTRRLLQLVPLLEGASRLQVLEEALGRPDEASIDLLCQVVRLAPDRLDLLDRAIQAARDSREVFSRKGAIEQLAGVVPSSRLDELLPLVDGAGSDEHQAEVLTVLAERLSATRRGELAARAFALLSHGEDFKGAGVTAVKERARVVRLLPPEQQAAAATGVMTELERLKSDRHRLVAIADVVPFLTGLERTRAELRASELAGHVDAFHIAEVVEDGGRGRWLAAAAPEFCQPLLTALVEAARNAETSSRRIAAIAALLPCLDPARARAVLIEEERHARLIGDVEQRVTCIGALTRTLPPAAREPVVSRMLAAIADGTGGRRSGRSLAALAPVAAAGQLDRMADALSTVQGLERARAAAALFAANARLGRWDRALGFLPELDNGHHLRLALDQLPEEVPAEVVRTILRGAADTADAELGATAIAPLARRLPEDEREAACELGLQAAEVLRLPDRYRLLEALIPAIPCERLDAASALISDDDHNALMERDGALVALAVRRGDCGDLPTAISILDRMTYVDARCRACVQWCGRTGLPEEIRFRFLEWAETFADGESNYMRVELLAEVARQHTEPHRSRLLEKALALARAIKKSSKSFVVSANVDTALALASLAPLVDASRQADIMLEAWDRAADAGTERARGLEAVAPLVATLGPDRIAARWRNQLERVLGERRDVLAELEVMAPVIERLGGEDGVLGVIAAIETTARWWP